MHTTADCQGRRVQHLAADLGEPNRLVRLRAAAALCRRAEHDEAAADALLDGLQAPDPLVRRTAALALGDLGHLAGRAVPLLVAALDDAGVRRQAIFSLANLGSAARSAAPTLARMAEEGDEGLRQLAAWAVGRIDPAAG